MPLTLKNEHVKYFLGWIIKTSEIGIITQLCGESGTTFIYFANEESEGADPFVEIDEGKGEDELEENEKAGGLLCCSHPR